jgi:membrane protease YdiL (CAAX protease family)
MDTPTLYLDCLILAAATHPSGFSHSLFTLRRGTPGEISTAFLVFLAGPYLAVTVAVLAVRSGLVACKGTTAPLLALAALAAPAALSIEVVIHSLVSLGRTGRWPRGIALERSWSFHRSPTDHLLLILIVLGEEIFYRVIWLGVLEGSCGLPFAVALALSSMAYGLNHLAFGATSVVSKTAAGMVYGLLYRLGGGSVWLPFAAHALQNLLLFQVAAARRGHA